jgi:hypothetical protein
MKKAILLLLLTTFMFGCHALPIKMTVDDFREQYKPTKLKFFVYYKTQYGCIIKDNNFKAIELVGDCSKLYRPIVKQ